ncbi:hypothetical protein Scep_018775 [Stephania cephalantha]|uniref:BZIP domain-containing protein n=1 Tax=Stephania cephalantha TaxID=152367 RepID=A0AAP0IAL2_9MAGN
MEPQFNPTFGGVQFPGRMEIEQMPETPQRVSHHRRAHSETFFRLPDDFLFDAADVDFALSPIDIPSISDDASAGVPMAVDASAAAKSEDSAAENPKRGKPPPSHFRSLSVGSEFFEGLGFQGIGGGGGDGGDGGGGQERRGHHRHSNSMDGSSSSFEIEAAESAKKAMGPDKLAELARIDPKRAKRILANRQSAARSKERKIRYTGELERKVQTLQTEATTLSAQVTMLQRDTSGLTAENKELKLRLQAMEQEAHLRDALNEALKDEVQRLKIATGQAPAVNGNSFNRVLSGSFLSPSQPLHNFNIPQNQHHQPLNMSASSINNQSHGGPPQHKRV